MTPQFYEQDPAPQKNVVERTLLTPKNLLIAVGVLGLIAWCVNYFN